MGTEISVERLTRLINMAIREHKETQPIENYADHVLYIAECLQKEDYYGAIQHLNETIKFNTFLVVRNL